MQRKFVDKILNSGYKASLIITGGGTGAIANLLRYGGGSKFLLNAEIPYAKLAFLQASCGIDKDFVSQTACQRLAECAFVDSQCFVPTEDEKAPLIGVACTAKLAYDGERIGREHCAYIGIESGDGSNAYYLFDFPQQMSREEQEDFLAEGILACIFLFVTKDERYQLPSHIKELELE